MQRRCRDCYLKSVAAQRPTANIVMAIIGI
jgi:hypothetical protein